MHFLRDLGGHWTLQSGSRSLQHIGFRRGAFNWHGFGNRGPLDL
jgi:hypothetical protein